MSTLESEIESLRVVNNSLNEELAQLNTAQVPSGSDDQVILLHLVCLGLFENQQLLGDGHRVSNMTKVYHWYLLRKIIAY